ncbi:MAG: ABC transporter substrate-binding protein [Bacteroidetes bacterium]|nr:ABC transporter substrate-binding protein [Bacteroidota bacterium]
MRAVNSFCVILVGLLLIVGCTSQMQDTQSQEYVPGVSDSEIVIGSTAALSGHASFLGTQTVHGSLAYIEEVNANGGVHGRQIRLISYDDQYDPPKTVANTQKLISEDGVFALFDYVGTPTSVKIIDFVHQAEVPILGFFTGAEALRTPFRPYIFNVRDSYYNEAEGVTAYFVDKLGLKKIAVMYQEDAFGTAVLSGVQLAMERRNMELVATDTFVRGTMDVEKAMETIKKSGAEAVIMVGTYDPLAKFIKISNDAGFTPYFHTVSFVGSEAFGKQLVEVQKVDSVQYDKIIVTQVVPSPFSDEFSTVKEYKELAKKYYPQDEPNFVALEGFINAKILVKALELTGKDPTRDKFIEALESMQNVGIGIGKAITYSANDHQGLQGIYYSKLTEDGTFRIFTP